MKLSFDVKNDFDSTYYLPGYDCVVHVEVRNGIVELNIEDDFLDDDVVADLDLDEDEDDYNVFGNPYSVDDEDDDKDVEIELDIDGLVEDDEVECSKDCNNPLCDNYETCYRFSENSDHNCTTCWLDGSTTTWNGDIEYTNGYIEPVEGTFKSVEKEEDDITKSSEYEFAKKLAKMDESGVVIGLLTDLLKNKDVKDTASKVGKTFNKIMNNLSSVLKMQD